jgi:hypothetical protein
VNQSYALNGVRQGSLGKLLQVAYASDATYSTGTTLIPYDDTIPQNTEGDEVLTLAITPLSATSILVIDYGTGMCTTSTLGRVIIGALFVDSTADAIDSFGLAYDASAAVLSGNMTQFITPSASTSERTYKFRIGAHAVGTTYVNGHSSARLYGGTCPTKITITEIEV